METRKELSRNIEIELGGNIMKGGSHRWMKERKMIKGTRDKRGN